MVSEQGTMRRVGLNALASAARTCLVWTPAVLVALAPWFYANGDDDYSGPVIVLGAVQMLALALRLALSRTLPRSPALGVVALLMAWLGITTFHSIAMVHSVRGLALWGAGTAIFLGLLLPRPSVRQLRQITLLLVTSVAALCLRAMIDAYTTRSGFNHLSATFSNSDCFGALVLMALALAMGLVPLPTMAQNRLLLGDLLVLFAGLVATSSRGAFLGAGVVCAILAVRRFRGRRPSKGVIFILLTLVAVLGVLAVMLAGPELEDRLNQTLHEEGSEGWSVRAIVLKGWLWTLARSPWMGSGLATFHLAFQPDRPHGLFTGYVNQAHMDLVQVAVETGLVGLLLFLGLLGYALVAGWRCRGTHSLVGPVAGLAGVTTYGLVNFALPVPADLLWYFALLGLTFSYIQAASRREPIRPLPTGHRVCVADVLGLVLPVLLLVGARQSAKIGLHTLVGMEYAKQAERLAGAQHWMEAEDSVSTAIGLDPQSERYYMQRADILQQLGERSGSWSLIQGAQEDYRTALSLNPRAKFLRLRMARLLERWGEATAAEALLKQAVAGYPEDPGPWTELATLCQQRGETRHAAEDLLAALANDSGEVKPAGTLLAQVESETPGQGCALLKQFNSRTADAGATVSLGLTASKAAVDAHPQAAAALAQEVLQLVPNQPDCQVALADIALRQGHARQALQSLQEASHVGQDSLGSYVHRVIQEMADERGDLHQAVTLVLAYLHQVPADNAERVQLAQLYVALQDPAAASRTYQEAIRINPNDATLYAAVGAVALQHGDIRQARMMYMEATRLSPTNPAYEQILSDIEKKSSQEPAAP